MPTRSRETWWVAGIVFAVALGVYATTAARTVTLVDSGELILTAATLGVAHPPGFPLYTLVGFLWSQLPVGSIAFRLSLMSGFFAAVASALLALITTELLRRERMRLEIFAPLAVGLTAAFSLTLWAYATVAEVYTLNLALLAAVVFLLLSWRRAREANEEKRARRMLIAAAFCYGLALGVHHATVVLFFAGIAVFGLRTLGWQRLRVRELLAPALATLAGLGIYLYLPLAAAREPLFSWGDPSTFERLWRHVSAWQYQAYLSTVEGKVVAENFRTALALLWRQFTPVGLAVALVGFVALWRRDRSVFWLATLIVLTGMGYAIIYDIAEDSDAYLLTTFFAFLLALAAGLGAIWRWGEKRGRGAHIACMAFLLALPASNLFLHWAERDRSSDRIARNYVEDALAGVGEGGLLMTLDWQLYSPFLYLHHLEGLRPDVTMVDVNLVRRSWYVDGYLRRVYPEMMTACEKEVDAFLAQLRRFERGEPYEPAVIQSRFLALLEAMIAHHLPEREAHLTLPLEPGLGTRYQWVPVGLSFQLFPAPPTNLPPIPDLHLAPLETDLLDEVARLKVRPTYAAMLANRARMLDQLGQNEDAQLLLEAAKKLDPNLTAVQR